MQLKSMALLDQAISKNSQAVSGLIASAAAQSQGLPGDVRNLFYLAFEENGYTVVTDMLNGGSVGAFLSLSLTVIFNAVFTLSNLNAILPYCDDTTYDALAGRIASLVNAFYLSLSILVNATLPALQLWPSTSIVLAR
jgi:hypothetical protein